MAFIDDLKSRLASRVQLTTDGLKVYLEAVEGAFGADIDYAQVIKLYGKVAGYYSPMQCVGMRKKHIEGSPDYKRVSTSHAERNNLNVRMHSRRYTRLTNAHSKTIRHHAAMTSLFVAWYNYCRTNSACGKKTIPAMAATLTGHVWSIKDLLKQAV